MQDVDAINPTSGKALCIEGIHDNVQSPKKQRRATKLSKAFFDFLLWQVISQRVEMVHRIIGKQLKASMK